MAYPTHFGPGHCHKRDSLFQEFHFLYKYKLKSPWCFSVSLKNLNDSKDSQKHPCACTAGVFPPLTPALKDTSTFVTQKINTVYHYQKANINIDLSAHRQANMVCSVSTYMEAYNAITLSNGFLSLAWVFALCNG